MYKVKDYKLDSSTLKQPLYLILGANVSNSDARFALMLKLGENVGFVRYKGHIHNVAPNGFHESLYLTLDSHGINLNG